MKSLIQHYAKYETFHKLRESGHTNLEWGQYAINQCVLTNPNLAKTFTIKENRIHTIRVAPHEYSRLVDDLARTTRQKPENIPLIIERAQNLIHSYSNLSPHEHHHRAITYLEIVEVILDRHGKEE